MLDDRLIHLIAAHAAALRLHDAGQRNHRHLRGAAADIHDHVSVGLRNRKSRSDCRRHRLLDQKHLTRAGMLGTVLHGAGLHLGDPGGNRHEHTGLHQTVPGRHQHLRLRYEVPEHLLGDLEVRDHTALHGPDRLDVQGTAIQHPVCFLPNRDHLFGHRVYGDHGRFGKNDPLVFHIDKAVRRPQINPDVAGKKLCQSLMYHRDFLQSD